MNHSAMLAEKRDKHRWDEKRFDFESFGDVKP